MVNQLLCRRSDLSLMAAMSFATAPTTGALAASTSGRSSEQEETRPVRRQAPSSELVPGSEQRQETGSLKLRAEVVPPSERAGPSCLRPAEL